MYAHYRPYGVLFSSMHNGVRVRSMHAGDGCLRKPSVGMHASTCVCPKRRLSTNKHHHVRFFPTTDHVLVVGLQRAPADFQELGVPPEPLHLILVAVPVPTKNLKEERSTATQTTLVIHQLVCFQPITSQAARPTKAGGPASEMEPDR